MSDNAGIVDLEVTMKKGDQVETPHGKGEIYRLYYSGESGKPYSAHIKYPSGEVQLVFLSECKKL